MEMGDQDLHVKMGVGNEGSGGSQYRGVSIEGRGKALPFCF